jgi:Secretion system C-terminal sorting domain
VTVSCGAASEQGGVSREQEIGSSVQGAGSSAGSAPAMTLTLAPNPTDGRFNLELQGFAKQALVTIFDATGRQVWQQRVGSETLTSALMSVAVDLSDARFNAGLYLVTVASDGTVLTKRLVLTR